MTRMVLVSCKEVRGTHTKGWESFLTMSNNNNNSNQKETDITVYGATSFAANHVLRYLLSASKQFQVDGKLLRVTLAGRSQSKLEALRELDVFQNNRTATDMKVFHDIFVAEASDGPALEEMARRTKVILNCAGPFERYSSLVVAACAKVGTDYVDITGEGPWSATMRLKYGPQAKVSGARIISFCGYDSIPSDMVLWAAVDALRQRKKTDSSTVVEMDSATIWHCMGGVPNGGTIQTVVDFPIDLWKDFFQTNGTLRSVPFFAGDPLLLTHPALVRHNPDYESTKNRFARGEWMNQLFHIDIPFGLGISLPMVMAAINM
jgi:short subunit dehydrogenase-like uncharacterized protein